MIYLDNAATSPIRVQAREAMFHAMELACNPSSLHAHGRRAHALLETAREQVARLVGAAPNEIFFTSGGTEAINQAFYTVERMYGHAAVDAAAHLPYGSSAPAAAHSPHGNLSAGTAHPHGHLAIGAMEHHAVLHAAERARDTGFSLSLVEPDAGGVIQPEALTAALTPDTRMAAVMAVNNEVGTLQPIARLTELCAQKGVLFFCDAVQAAGHIPIDVQRWGVDLLAISSHKFNGPMGVGALYVKKGVTVHPLLVGGGQERGLRSGTQNLPGIVGMGVAAQWACDTLAQESARVAALREAARTGIAAVAPNAVFNGNPDALAPGILSVTFRGLQAEALHMLLDMQGISTSIGAACGAGTQEFSHVLRAMGVDNVAAQGTLRISFGLHNTMEDVDKLVAALGICVGKLLKVSPVRPSRSC